MTGRARRLRFHAAFLLLLALFAAAALAAMRDKAATSDEPVHLAAGASYVATRDFRMNPEHPPLVKLLAGLAVAPLAPHVPLEDASWAAPATGEFRFGALFLYGDRFDVDADRLLFRGRVPTLALALLLGAVVYLWGTELAGPWGGLAAAALTLATPEVLGHAQLVTTDLPVTAFLVTACFLARKAARSIPAALAFGLAAGAAMASKYSGVLVWPMALPFVLGHAGHDGPAADASRPSRTSAAGRVARTLAITFLAALVVLSASTLFTAGPLAYLDGLRRVNANHDPGYPFYLLGEFRRGRFWSYFAVAYLVKTPVGFLFAALLGLAALLRRHPLRDGLPLVLAPALVFVSATLLADDIGVRYVLPATPFLALAAAAALHDARRAVRALVAACAIATVLETAWRFPDDLSFFNVAAGGPERGPFLLDDSNIDWGQDLKRVPAWLREHAVHDATLVYYWRTSAPPRVYLDPRAVTIAKDAAPLFARPASGTYLVSAQYLVRLRDPRLAPRPGAPDWLRDLRPSGRVGYGIRVYDFGRK